MDTEAPNAEAIERIHVLVRGRVQGVGYRYSVQDQAVRLGVNGWVRNRPDGAVEAEFEAPRSVLEVLTAWCRQGPRLARVDAVECTTQPPRGEIGFQIKR